MDIEEGEIIISDVSSDDSNDHGTRPWNRDKFQVDVLSFRYQDISTAYSVSSSTREKGRHCCNEQSFCRKTFSWKKCLARGSSGQRDRSLRNRERGSDTCTSDSVSRIQSQRVHLKQKHKENCNNDHRHVHDSQRTKKRKKKRKNESSHRPEKSLHQLIRQCENQSALFNEMIQRSRATSSATVVHENNSLMQKLITSGLANPPVRPGVNSNKEINAPSSESRPGVKVEPIPVINIENNDYSDDSEIEVIIPPKKVPPLVTLDSDGEELDQLKKDSVGTDPTLETLRNEVQQTSSAVNIIPRQDTNDNSNENEPNDTSLQNTELSARNTPHDIVSELVCESSDSLGSSLRDLFTYSPSSPSSCISSDVNSTKQGTLEPSASIGIITSKNLQCGENCYEDFSSVSNEEISSEIWLSGPQTSSNQEGTTSLTSSQTDPSKKVNKHQVSSESINNENPILGHDNSLSSLVENFIMCSMPFRDDDNTKKQEMCVNENSSPCQDLVKNSSQNSSQEQFDEGRDRENEGCSKSDKAKNVKNNQMCKNLEEDKNQTKREEFDNDIVLDTVNSNKFQLLSRKKMAIDDQEPYSPSSNYSCEIAVQNDLFTLVSSSNKSCITEPEQQLDVEPQALESSSNLKNTVSAPDHTRVSECIVSVLSSKESEENKDQENKRESIESCANQNNESSSYNCEEDNVSHLRMIALQTKGKALCKETNMVTNSKSNSQQESNKSFKDVAATEDNPQEVTDEDDILQLRVAALKSAVMKKYGERKKRGLLIKKRNSSSSGYFNDIFTLPESNLHLEKESSSPLSPAKSSTSLQGEEDMELAESDFGEEEDINASSANEPKPSNSACASFHSMTSPSAIHAHSPNKSMVELHQPLPPGVDKDSPELMNQTIFSSILPPPPPPPPPPLAFSPMLPPPPPPPFPTSSSDSFSQLNQSLSPNPKENIFQKEFDGHLKTSSSPSYEYFLNNERADGLSCNNKLVGSKRLKREDFQKNQERGNLITVPVVKPELKPFLTKNQVRKKTRRGKPRRRKSNKVLTESDTNVLCITKPPGKSSIKINSKTSVQDNTNLGYGVSDETNPKICCTSNEVISPAVLCNTNQQAESQKNSDNLSDDKDIWHKQDLIPCIVPTKSSLCEEPSSREDEIDLSEMIVLDEVGMSPEHKTKNESIWDYNSPQEEEEDENTLRIRALTTLSPKPVVEKPTSNDISRSQPIQNETYYKGWETNELSNPKKGFMSPKLNPKEVYSQRRVVGIDTSKYKLTRTRTEQRRSVVHGRESLKVVVPTNSPPQTTTIEPNLPVVKRLVINVNKDSDSEEECEWTRKIRIQENTTTTPPLGPVVDHDLERSIDELLMRARNSIGCNAPFNQNQDGKDGSPNYRNRDISKNDFGLHDTPLKLLPKEKQEEYKRLKAILERKEKERQQSKKLLLGKAPESPKPLLQHVLVNENNKQIQKGKISIQESILTDENRRGRVQSTNYRVVSSNSCAKNENFSEKDILSSPVQDPANNTRQDIIQTESSIKGSYTRKVVCNDASNNLNIDTVKKSIVLSHDTSQDRSLQSNVVKGIDKFPLVINNNVFETNEEIPNYQRNSKEATHKKLVCSTSQLSINNSIKKKQINLARKVQQQSTTALDLKNLQKDSDSHAENRSNQLENENSSRKATAPISHSNEKISSYGIKASEISALADSSTCDSSKELCTDKREFYHSENSKVNNLGSNNATQQINENEQRTSLVDRNIKKTDISSHASEFEKEQSFKITVPNGKNSDSNENDAKSLKSPRSSDTLDYLNAPPKEQDQNICLREELSVQKSELLSERFGLLDDLSEMAESLDELDGQQGRLEQAAAEISDLRRALRAAEEALRRQVSETQSLERRLHETHSAVSARYANIERLEMTLQHASFEVPTTAQKLLTKKVKQVKEKMEKVKSKRSILNCLTNKPDTTKKQLAEMHANLLERKAESTVRDDEITSNEWLQDPKSSQLEDFCVRNLNIDLDNKTDTGTQTLISIAQGNLDTVLVPPQPCADDQPKTSENPVVSTFYNNESEKLHSGDRIACLQTSDASVTNLLASGSSSSSIESVQPHEHFVSRSNIEDIASKLKNLGQQAEENYKSSFGREEVVCKETCALKRPIDQVSGVSETVSKKPNLMGDENSSKEMECNMIDDAKNLETSASASHESSEKIEDVAANSGLSRISKSKLQYKSILQYRDPSPRVEKSSGQAILCPYDLTGRCQDKECKFQHFH